MAGKGVDAIPVRAPREWDAAWFERFVREVLALADVRNAVEGAGISITSNPNDPATLSAAADVQTLLDATLVTVTASELDNARVLDGETDVIEIDDQGETVVVKLRPRGIGLGKLADIPGLAVVGSPLPGNGPALAIQSSNDDTVVRRVDGRLSWGQLTAGMFADDTVPDAALSENVALYDGDVAGFTAGTFADERIAESNVTQHEAALSIGFDQLEGVPQIPGGLSEFADDAAAETGGIAVNGLYRTGSVVKIRVA